MAVTTLVIALLPTYETIGVWAGVILLVCRILQGVSTGIEAPLSTAYAVELSPEGREGRAAGYMSFFVNLGILLASLTSFVTSYRIGADAMASGAGGSRSCSVPRWASSSSVPAPRAPRVADRGGQGRGRGRRATIWGGIRKHWLGLLAIIFVVGAAQAYNYAWNVGLPSLARGRFGENPTDRLRDHHDPGCRPARRLAWSPARLADRYNLSRRSSSPGCWRSRRCS